MHLEHDQRKLLSEFLLVFSSFEFPLKHEKFCRMQGIVLKCEWERFARAVQKRFASPSQAGLPAIRSLAARSALAGHRLTAIGSPTFARAAPYLSGQVEHPGPLLRVILDPVPRPEAPSRFPLLDDDRAALAHQPVHPGS